MRTDGVQEGVPCAAGQAQGRGGLRRRPDAQPGQARGRRGSGLVRSERGHVLHRHGHGSSSTDHGRYTGDGALARRSRDGTVSRVCAMWVGRGYRDYVYTAGRRGPHAAIRRVGARPASAAHAPPARPQQHHARSIMIRLGNAADIRTTHLECSSDSIAVVTADTSCDASASSRGPSRRQRSSSPWRAAFAQMRSECS